MPYSVSLLGDTEESSIRVSLARKSLSSVYKYVSDLHKRPTQATLTSLYNDQKGECSQVKSGV